MRTLAGVCSALVGLILGVGLSMGPGALHAAEPVLQFDGSDSYVLLGTAEVLQIPDGTNFTVEGWMYFDSLSTRDMLYSKNSARGTPYTYMFGFADGKMSAYDDSSWQGGYVVNRQIGRWYHLAFSFDGTNITYYLDGNALGSSVFNFANNASHTAKIGGYNTSSDINGSISDLRVWDHARSGAEIRAGMAGRLSGLESGLLGYWPMDEGVGANICDQTTFASTGTVIGASWSTNDSLTLYYGLAVSALPPVSVSRTNATANGRLEFAGFAENPAVTVCWGDTSQKPW